MDAAAGYSLRARDWSFTPDEETTWSFDVVGPGGRPRSYRVQHERELHLIVVRDDLSTFSHLHPQRGQNGTWTVQLSLPVAGSYTAFVDVAPDDAEAMTLRFPLTADGEVLEVTAFAPSKIATPDDYRVELFGDVVAGDSSHVEFRVTQDGEDVEPQPYLGAAGHLVAIRVGDLDYLHVHPMDASRAGSIPFMMHAPSPGLYRLFLQFLHEGAVRTADFTIEAVQPSSHH